MPHAQFPTPFGIVRTAQRARVALATSMIAALASAGCPRLVTTTTTTEREVIDTERLKALDGGWAFGAKAALDTSTGDLHALSLQVTRHQPCTVTERAWVQTREVTRGAWPEGGRTLVYGLLAASLGAALGGLAYHLAADAPLTGVDEVTGESTVTGTGHWLAWSSALAVNFVGSAGYNEWLTRTSSHDLGEAVEDAPVTRRACNSTPAEGARVRVATKDGDLLASTVVEPDGRARFVVTDADLAFAFGPYVVVVDQDDLESILRPPDLSELLGPLAEKATRKAAAAGQRGRRRREDARVAVTQEELRTGRCDAKRAELARLVPKAAAPILEVLAQAGGTTYELQDSRAVVATPAGTSFVHEATRHGTLHALVVGYSDLAVALRPDGRSEFGMPSELGGLVQAEVFSNEVRVPSTTAQVAAGDQVEVVVAGEGCAVVLLYAAW